MLRSEQINELTAALCKAQAVIPNPPKNKTVRVKLKSGGEYTYMYADFPSIMDLIRKPLSDNGLCITHTVDWSIPAMVSTLSHTSGQYITSTIMLKVNIDPSKNEMQQWASAFSFSRRYNTANLVNLAAEDDDDAQATGKDQVDHGTGEVRKHEEKVPGLPLSEAQCAELDSLLNEDLKKEWVITKTCEKHNLKSIYDIDSNMFVDVKNWLLNRKKLALEKK
jgi:hypothetical protein